MLLLVPFSHFHFKSFRVCFCVCARTLRKMSGKRKCMNCIKAVYFFSMFSMCSFSSLSLVCLYILVSLFLLSGFVFFPCVQKVYILIVLLRKSDNLGSSLNGMP